jgi:hypothetical protein
MVGVLNLPIKNMSNKFVLSIILSVAIVGNAIVPVQAKEPGYRKVLNGVMASLYANNESFAAEFLMNESRVGRRGNPAVLATLYCNSKTAGMSGKNAGYEVGKTIANIANNDQTTDPHKEEYYQVIGLHALLYAEADQCQNMANYLDFIGR